MTEVKAPKNGYVYVYLSNESATPVYFDDFSVSHNRSALIGEDHYYSFGLRIAAISSKAVATSLNAKLPTYGYQGAFAEEVTDFELAYNEFDLRTYDPQIGRWTGIDPYDEFASPYVGMGNDPTNLNDPSGGFTGAIASGIFQGMTQLGKSAVMTLAGAIVGMAVDLSTGGEGSKGAAIGAGLGLGASFITSTMLKSALTWLGEFALAAGPSAVQQSWSIVARTPSIGSLGGMSASAPNAPTTLSGTSPTIDLTPPPVHMPTMQAPPATNPTTAPSIPTVVEVQPPPRPTPPPVQRPPVGRPPAPRPINTSAQLAQTLINSRRAVFASRHPNPTIPNDMANADDNIRDAAQGLLVHTSEYGHARGRMVNLSPQLLNMLVTMSSEYTFGITELAGARHSGPGSIHYQGRGVDIYSINGIPVNSRNPFYRQFMNRARQLGAIQILGPGDAGHSTHIHFGTTR